MWTQELGKVLHITETFTNVEELLKQCESYKIVTVNITRDYVSSQDIAWLILLCDQIKKTWKTLEVSVKHENVYDILDLVEFTNNYFVYFDEIL